MKKKILLLSVAAVATALLLVGGTLAWMTDKADSTGTVTVGAVTVQLHDVFEQDSSALPSQTIPKQVYASNAGNQPIYVRIRVEKKWAEDSTSSESEDQKLDTDLIQINFLNSADWVEGEPGVYYYQKPLEPNAETSHLFDSFTLGEKMDNRYDGKKGEISVTAEAIQSKYSEKLLEKNDQQQVNGWGDVTIEGSDASPFNQ